MPVTSIRSYLAKGDPLEPYLGDLIAQEGRLPVGEPVPDGWRVVTGNTRESQVVRIVTRWELDEES